MKILIPTDFSKLSKVAVVYAANLAKKLSAEITLLHVVYVGGPGRSQTAVKTQPIEQTLMKISLRDMEKVIKEIRKEVGPEIKITQKIIEGYPIEEIVEKIAGQNDIDLIIMGTKGAGGLKKVVVGSNAAAVIGNSKIPVIAVPRYARFKNIKHIVYASDMLALTKEVKTLITFARLFNATMYLFHVLSGPGEKIDAAEIKKELIRKYKYPKVSVHISANDDVMEAIDEYIADVEADMLAMFTHKPTFFEKLFGKSITREMAFHSQVPLLAIKKAT